MITRRLALFRIASASAVAAVPVAIMAIQPKTAEDPALVRLGQKASRLDAICQRRKAAKAAARSIYENAVPSLPDELIVTRYSEGLADSERETNCDNEDVWPDDLAPRPPKRYHTAYHLRRALEDWSDLEPDELDDDEREAVDYLQLRLSIAERYETGIEEALAQSGYHTSSGAHYLACYALERIVTRLAKIPAMTPDGITIKAQAYDAWVRSGHDRAKQFAAIIIGPGLAADVCRVLSEGGEA
jgi:hypothetical protein